jgi:hypothetical protein
MQWLINTPVTLPFISANLATGLTTFSSSILINNVVVALSPTFTEIGGGLYTITFTPQTSGVAYVFINGVVLPGVEVVSKTATTILQNLEDEALGSWTWDKALGKLTLLRANGTTLSSFNVVDNLSTASRERI